MRCRAAGIFLLLVALFGTGAGAAAQRPGTQTAQTVAGTASAPFRFKYLLHLPREYGRDARRWPLILYLHGGSLRGDDLEMLKRYGLPRMLDSRPDFPFIVVSPQCPPGETWTDAAALIRLLDDVQARFAVDRRRVYVTGVSMGGSGAWYLAFRHPERFAAIVPVAAYSPIAHWASSGRLRSVPVWAFHGARDSLASVAEARSMVRLLKNAGGRASLTVFPDRGHSIADVYDDPRLYAWLLRNVRAAPAPAPAPPR